MKLGACVLLAALMATAAAPVVSASELTTTSRVVAERLRVVLAFDGRPLPPLAAASAIEELEAIWMPYGVQVRVAGASDATADADVSLRVSLADDRDPRLAADALGSIRFVEGEPQSTITMYWSAIEALISTVSIAGSHNLQWPSAFHDAIVGRVLGRGVAHEIGHYLLRARRHSEVGLMRAPHAIPDLVAGDRQHFALTADDQKRLTATIAASVALSSQSAHHSADYSR